MYRYTCTIFRSDISLSLFLSQSRWEFRLWKNDTFYEASRILFNSQESKLEEKKKKRAEIKFPSNKKDTGLSSSLKIDDLRAEASRNHMDRERPHLNRESCTLSKHLTSSAIGRHLARHCFIHACCTFLVYLVQSLLASFYISTRDISCTIFASVNLLLFN